ncbi:MAG: sigma-70 family RNA polymerase sigma factor [Bacteroidetes bacterium]|nr:sigma-70 family RNA polymerase sigma factor [Bacteroidota bacterium]
MAWKDFENESTADLIEYIKWGNQPEYKDTAGDAFIAFCFRFREDLQRKCRVICRNWGYDNSVADEIAEKAFARFLKYPKYKHAKCKSGDIEKCVRLYLYGFAGNLLADHRKAEKQPPSPFTGDEKIITEFPDIEAMNITVERKAILTKQYEIIKCALERLTPKHKTIYLTYKQYEYFLNQGFYFKRSFLKRMQDELELSQATIRVYKKEAFDKIAEYLKIYGSK